MTSAPTLDPPLLAELAGMYRRGCVFCAPHHVLHLGGTENFALTVDMAPLTEGHLVLHAREHTGCAGEVPRDQYPELLALKVAVRENMRAAYGAITFFEHGRAGSCLSEGPEHRLCHHMHLHAVPGDHDVSGVLDARFDGVELATYEEIVDLYETSGHYLYLERSDGRMSFYPVAETIERHLMRSLIARHIGRPERADWQRHAEPALLAAGLATMRSAVGRLAESLPGFRLAAEEIVGSEAGTGGGR
jgi:diadenosine tetraphosphate (Ap4A) HIT family hydrolase